jgi:pyridoxal phosphate enzyme (YggS family)
MEYFMENFDYIMRNYKAMCEELSGLSDKYKRNITLVAVTKSATDEELLALAACGITDIGENRPQELARRGELLKQHGYTPRLHEIGNLQKNKVRTIIGDVSLIHSLDGESLAKEINRRAEAAGRRVPVLIEINSAREEQKGGVMPEDAEALIRSLEKYENIALRGLMTMGPVCEGEEIRPYFRLTKKLFDELSEKGLLGDKPVLSMGMSDSYKIAIEEGADIVRVGRRLFIK